MCSSEVSDTDIALREAFADAEGVTTLWVFAGSAQQARRWQEDYGLELPIAADEDNNFEVGWWVGEEDGHAWAASPRHFVLDGDWVLRYASTTPIQSELVEAIEGLVEGG